MAKSKDKKRKSTKHEQDDEVPDVKKGEKVETLDLRIKSIGYNNPDKGENQDKKSLPIIGYFPSGYDPLKNCDDHDPESESNSSFKVYKSLNSRNPKNPRMQVVVGASGSHVNFVGTNYSGEATRPHLCDYALGVLDKETGVLKMVPIAANRIFRLEPKIASLEQAENDVNDEAEVNKAGEMAYKLKRLADAYSTKKDIRRDVKRETVRQTEDPELQEDMDQKLKGIKINAEALEAIKSSANALNIPPYDLDATTAENAYPLDRIILKGEWDYLLDVYDLAQDGSGITPDVYPSFVCNRVHKLEDIKDESKRKRTAGILSYITHLIKYKDRHSMDGVSSAKRHKLPSILLQKFSSMFGATNEKRLPEDKQQLLINYVLVLTLFADDFQSDPSDIANDLRMDPGMLRTHYDYLGCKYGRKNHVVLPVPLVFHQTKRIKRRR